MKKILPNSFIYCLSLVCLTFVMSCSEDDHDPIQSAIQIEKSDDLVFISEDGVDPDSITESIVSINSEAYIFENPHSELWKNEINKNLKSKNFFVISVKGYDEKQFLGSYHTMFLSGLSCDSRIRGEMLSI